MPGDARATSIADADLVVRALAGDVDACKDIYVRHRKVVFRAVSPHASSEEEARDLLREGFVAIYRNLARYSRDDEFPRWASRIAATQAKRLVGTSRSRSRAESGEGIQPTIFFWKEVWRGLKPRIKTGAASPGPGRGRPTSPQRPARDAESMSRTADGPPPGESYGSRDRDGLPVSARETIVSNASAGGAASPPPASISDDLDGDAAIPSPSLEVQVACAATTGAPVPFGRYEILGEIARGGMGIVFRARDTSLRREVALKVLKAGAEATERQIRRFRREGQAASRLRHPGIVTVHDVGNERGYPYLTMELIDGVALDEFCKEHRPEPMELARLVSEVARALEHAHDAGLVHRDLKPANVLVTREGEAKVTDFGLAQLDLEDDEGGRLTRTGAAVGTPFYMAPEQVRGDNDVDRRADTWAIGVVLFECLTGAVPFNGATVVEVYRQILDREAKSVRKWDPTIPAVFDDVIARCLEKEREHRYQRADDVADDLDKIRKGEAPSAPPPGRRRRRAGRLLRGRAARVGAAVAVSVALAASGIAFALELLAAQGAEDDPAAIAAREAETRRAELRTSVERALTALEGVEASVASRDPRGARDALADAEAALAALEVAEDGDGPPHVVAAVRAYLEESRDERARLAWRAALSSGDVAALAGDPSAAASRYDIAAELAPETPLRRAARLRAIDLHIYVGDAGRALQLTAAVLTAADPTRPRPVLLRRGLALEIAGRPAEAAAAYDEVLAAPAPDDDLLGAGLLGRARARLAAGAPSRALEDAAALAERPTTGPDLARELVLLRARALADAAGRAGAARRAATEAADRFGSRAEPHILHARALLAARAGGAADVAESLDQARTRGASIWASLGAGALHERDLRPEEARRHYEAVIAAVAASPEGAPADLGRRLAAWTPDASPVDLARAAGAAVANLERAALAHHARVRLAVLAVHDDRSDAALRHLGTSDDPPATIAGRLLQARMVLADPVFGPLPSRARRDDPHARAAGVDSAEGTPWDGWFPDVEAAERILASAREMLAAGAPVRDEAELLTHGWSDARPTAASVELTAAMIEIGRHRTAWKPPEEDDSPMGRAEALLRRADERAGGEDPTIASLLGHVLHARPGRRAEAQDARRRALREEAHRIAERRGALGVAVAAVAEWRRSLRSVDRRAALAAVARAVEVSPASSTAYWLRAQLLRSSRTGEGAREGSADPARAARAVVLADLERAVHANPEDALALLGLIQIMIEVAENAEVERPFELAARAARLAESVRDADPTTLRALEPLRDVRIESRILAARARTVSGDRNGALAELAALREDTTLALDTKVEGLALEERLATRAGKVALATRVRGLLADARAARTAQVGEILEGAKRLLDEGDAEEAFPILDQALELLESAGPTADATTAEVYYTRGHVARATGRQLAALVDYARAGSRRGVYACRFLQAAAEIETTLKSAGIAAGVTELGTAIEEAGPSSPARPALLTARAYLQGLALTARPESEPEPRLGPLIDDLGEAAAGSESDQLATTLRILLLIRTSRLRRAVDELERARKRFLTGADDEDAGMIHFALAVEHAQYRGEYERRLEARAELEKAFKQGFRAFGQIDEERGLAELRKDEFQIRELIRRYQSKRDDRGR